MTVFNLIALRISELKNQGRIRTSETYRSTLASFRRFRDNHDLNLRRLTPKVVGEYERYLLNKGLCLNTTSFYMRILRSSYNRAIEMNIIPEANPFKRVYTGIARTRKRALDLKTIIKIKKLPLKEGSTAQLARDLFILSFYMRGISFIDLCYLRKCDVRNGFINYYRRKTGHRLRIAITPEINEIIMQYRAEQTPFLLSLLTSMEENEQRREYRRKSGQINYHLLRIGDQLGIPQPLTLYVARHSWATAAKSNGIPIQIISEGLGHNSESTTKIYLSSLETSAVDRANKIIIDKLSV